MCKYLAIAFFSVAASGCSSSPAKPQVCFAEKAPTFPYSETDQKALTSVTRRVGRTCGRPEVECNFDLRHNASGEIEVTVSRALHPPQCTRLEGGFETYVFSATGMYIRVVLGL